MPAPRKPDRELLAATEEARKRREEKQATFDRKVKRAHEAGNTTADIARELGAGWKVVRASLERQKLKPNEDALFI